MTQWIKRPQAGTRKQHFLCYERILHPGTGFHFECDERGVVNEAKLSGASRTSLAICRSDMFGDYRPPTIIVQNIPHVEAGVIACRCGRHLTLEYRGNNHCGCGRTYWGDGQEVQDEAHGL